MSEKLQFQKRLYPEASPPFTVIIQDGRPKATIVVSREATEVERYAASEMQKYLKKISGATLPIKLEDEESAGNLIYIGVCDAVRDFRPPVTSRFRGANGFVIESGDGWIAIVGAEDLDTLYGVYAFMEKYLGVRWFMPGEIGEVIPKMKTVKVGEIHDKEKPDFAVRWIGSGEWALKNRMNVNVTVKGKKVGVNWKWSFHSFFYLIHPNQYFDVHPEFYSYVRGRRLRPKEPRNAQLCTSNPELIREVAKNIIDLFDKDPTIDILSLCPNDGGGFCECKSCTSLDDPNADWYGRYSRRLAIFNNQVAELVAEKHPDKIIKVGAYAMYLRYPKDKDYKPAENLAVQVCHTYACYNHPVNLSTCERNQKMFTEDLIKWAKAAKHLFIYEYYHKGAWAGLPWALVHVIREDIPYYLSIGAEGFYTQCKMGNFHTVGLNYYVAAKLIWDSGLDVDALLDDFYDKFYGKAAEPMKKYFERMERAFLDYNDHISPFGYKSVSIAAREIFTEDVLADCEKYIKEAERLADDKLTRERVRMARITLDYTKMVMKYLDQVAKAYRGVDLKDKVALEAAKKKARRIGMSLAEEIKKFLRDNDRSDLIEPFEKWFEKNLL